MLHPTPSPKFYRWENINNNNNNNNNNNHRYHHHPRWKVTVPAASSFGHLAVSTVHHPVPSASPRRGFGLTMIHDTAIPSTPHPHILASSHPYIPPFQRRKRPDPLPRFNPCAARFYRRLPPRSSRAACACYWIGRKTVPAPPDSHLAVINHLHRLVDDLQTLFTILTPLSTSPPSSSIPPLAHPASAVFHGLRTSYMTFPGTFSSFSTPLQARQEPATPPRAHSSISVDIFSG
ncbi:hypothetical protein DFH09DRAFT_1505826 [Mycena vulgaris]|nr:hypothetical protein DFH09DRAFT_1505826 [Mycena vulgaris]